MKKRLLSTMLALCLVLTMLPLNALATDESPVETETETEPQETEPTTPENPTPVTPTEVTMDEQTTTPGSDNTDGLGNPLEVVPNDTILKEKSKALSEEVSEPMPLVNLPTSGTCGAKLTWRINGQTLTISGTGSMTDYESPSVLNMSTTPPWLYSDYEGNVGHMRRIQNVIIQDGVTSIGSHAFHDCEMTSITIPNSVVSIGEWAFASSNNLTELKLPNSITNIGNHAFYSMRSLNKINIPTSMTSLDGFSLFQFCSKLTSIEIPSNISKIDNGAFLGSSITNIKIPNSVKYIGDQAFAECDKMTGIDIPGSVTQIGEMAFRSCDSLSSISIANGTNSIKNYAFSECTNLKTVTIPNSVACIEYSAFSDCTSLTSVTLSSKMSCIEQNTFKNCKKLVSVTIPSSVTRIEQNAFSGCTGISDIYYSGTKSDWNNIDINETGNQYLDGVTVHCADGAMNYILGRGSTTRIYYDNGKSKTFRSSLESCMYSATSYNPRLAHMLVAICNSIHNKTDMEATFTGLGFDSKNTMTDYSMSSVLLAYGFGIKDIGNGNALVLIVGRGTADKDESIGNFKANTNSLGEHSDFSKTADNLYTQMLNFLNTTGKRLMPSLDTDNFSNIKFAITGHSRGGAVANLLAKKISDIRNGSDENIFAYTFACPDVAVITPAKAIRYPTIFNIGDAKDVVTWLPRAVWFKSGEADGWGKGSYWDKYGQSYWYCDNWSDKVSLDLHDWFSYHDQKKYLKDMSYEYGISTYRNRTNTMQVTDLSLLTGLGLSIDLYIWTRWGTILSVLCPVDVKIYTSDNQLAGEIIDNVANIYMLDKMRAYVVDDKKYIYMADDNYTVKLKGTGDGVMIYSVQSIDLDTGKVNEEKIFKDVKLSNGKQMISQIDVNNIDGTNTSIVPLYVLDENGSSIKEVLPDGNGTEVYISRTVTFNANGGTVNPTTMTTGTNGKLSSLPTPTRSGYRFMGWYTATNGGTQITLDTISKESI